MYNLDPNEMDALFKKGAENHEFTYNEDSWLLMEQKLNNRDRNRRFLWLFLGMIALFLAVGSFFYNSFQQNKDSAILIASTAGDKEDQPISLLETPIKNTDKRIVENNTTQKTASTKVESKESYINTDSKVRSSNIGAQNSFRSENTGSLVTDKVVSIASQTSNELDNKQNLLDSELISSVTKAYQLENESVNNKVTSNSNIHVDHLNNIEFTDLISNTKEYKQFDLQLIQNDIIILKPENRYALTVFANPEWSSVGLFSDSKVGWSVGGKIGYQFSDKFEFSIGLAYSRKAYNGEGGEYTMEGGWFDDIEPMKMEAKCDVIEIPLSMSYYVNGYKKSGFFMELGISSYMLHSEWYGFEYNDALVRPQEFQEVIKEDQNAHLVGVGRFAIGYQHIVSDRTSFQVSPYVQFPLTGIGAGQVSLYSSGVQLAVKFNSK